MRTLLAAALLCLFTVPAVAQDDYPRIQIGFGYANFSMPDLIDVESTKRNSGFSMHTEFNLTRWLGFENYTGYYGLGNNAELFTNIVGGKVMARTEKFVPFLVAGLGGANISQQFQGLYYSSGGKFATRLGGGVDYRMYESIGLRFDVSKLQFRTQPIIGGSSEWVGNANISIAVLFTLMQ